MLLYLIIQMAVTLSSFSPNYKHKCQLTITMNLFHQPTLDQPPQQMKSVPPVHLVRSVIEGLAGDIASPTPHLIRALSTGAKWDLKDGA